MIVAGGLATRMQPLTETIPKCLIDVHGKPLIEHQLDIFKAQGFTDFIFCVAHLAEKVKAYFGNGEKWGLHIQYSQDGEKLLGTAGAVKRALALLPDTFLVCYGDTISRQDFNDLVAFHFAQQAQASISLREPAEEYQEKKVVDSLIILDNDQITHFIEKPTPEIAEQYKNYPVFINNGIFVLNKNTLDHVSEDEKTDFSYDVFPHLITTGEKVCGRISHDFYLEIGRTEKHQKVLQENADFLENWKGEYS